MTARAGGDVWWALGRTCEATIRRTRYSPLADRLRRIATESIRSNDRALVEHSLACVYASRGQVRIEQLASDCQLSRRQYERRFKQQLGMTPKTLARIIRFEAVRDRLLSACSPGAFLTLAARRAMTHLSYDVGPRPPYRGAWNRSR